MMGARSFNIIGAAVLSLVLASGSCGSGGRIRIGPSHALARRGNYLQVDPFSGVDPVVYIVRRRGPQRYLFGGLGVQARAGARVILDGIVPVKVIGRLRVTTSGVIPVRENHGAFFNITCGVFPPGDWAGHLLPGYLLEGRETAVLVLEVVAGAAGEASVEGLRVVYHVASKSGERLYQDFGYGGVVEKEKVARRCSRNDRILPPRH